MKFFVKSSHVSQEVEAEMFEVTDGGALVLYKSRLLGRPNPARISLDKKDLYAFKAFAVGAWISVGEIK